MALKKSGNGEKIRARSNGAVCRSRNESDAGARLEAEARALSAAMAEFEHEARRVRDQSERQGGRAFHLEARLKQLQENMALTRRDLERVRRKLESEKSGRASGTS